MLSKAILVNIKEAQQGLATTYATELCRSGSRACKSIREVPSARRSYDPQ